jgi:formate dehydrogenase maturation protein FdhE
MTSTFPQSRRVELLINTLFSERYARRALLSELIDELADSPSLHIAAHAARSLLRSLDDAPIEQDLYEKRIVRIGDLAKRPLVTTD